MVRAGGLSSYDVEARELGRIKSNQVRYTYALLKAAQLDLAVDTPVL